MNTRPRASKGQIRTYTKRLVSPLDLKVTDIDLEDIGHALSNQCRFTGHAREFYSVAQHSVSVAAYLWDKHQSMELALAGLFHDASEAYLLDLARPIKLLPELEVFSEIEYEIQRTIEAALGFTYGEFEHPYVSHADRVLLATELRDLMDYEPDPGQETLACTLHPIGPKLAKSSWFSMLDFLTGHDRARLKPGRALIEEIDCSING